jgi:ADP-heptose:LPS heptosyltransferase
MNTFYLPIRSFGDFIITASVVKQNAVNKIPIILPDYFKEIFNAINAESLFDIQGTNNYKNQPAFFELYKVKDSKNFTRLINDIKIIISTVNHNDRYLVDYSSKRLAFTRANLVWPQKSLNAYEGRVKLFSDLNLINPDNSSANLINPVNPGEIKRVLILPDSRINIKSISPNLVKLIRNEFKSIVTSVAHFSANNNAVDSDCLYYSNFNDLIALISSYDLIISAESLPYHLANYLNKPHFVIYNQSRHFDANFMTPFMIANSYYSLFDGSNTKSLIADLSKILPGNA